MYMMQKKQQDISYENENQKAFFSQEGSPHGKQPGQRKADWRDLPRYSRESVRKNFRKNPRENPNESKIIQRTKASFLRKLEERKWKGIYGSVSYDSASHKFTFAPGKKKSNAFRFQYLAKIWREVTNFFHEEKEDWGADDKVSIYFNIPLKNRMEYEQEAVYSKSEEGYIEKETKRLDETETKDYMKHYQGSDGSGAHLGDGFDEGHEDTGYNNWHEKIAEQDKKTGDMGSKATAEAGRFEFIYNLEQPTDAYTENLTSFVRDNESVIKNESLGQQTIPVNVLELTQNYDTVSNWRYLVSLREEIQGIVDFSTYVEHILPVLQDENVNNRNLKLADFAGNHEHLDKAKRILEKLPEKAEDVKTKRQKGRFRRLPILNREIVATKANSQVGTKSEILTDKSGKGLGLKS